MVESKSGRKGAAGRPRFRRRFFTTKLCPNCLGELKPLSELSGKVTPESFYCEKCGYAGSVALERREDEPGE